jgi:SAM-dependent methyltransferase
MYELLARYYDQLHQSLTEDIPLVLALAAESSGPILELGCGTGRLLLPLARAGHEVVGLDNSPEMLARARRHFALEAVSAAGKVTLVLGDALSLPEPVTGRRYGLILIPYNTLLHFSEREAAALLHQAARVLEPHGRLFIDMASPFALAEQDDQTVPVLETTLRDEQTNALIEQWSRSHLDPEAQIMYVAWEFRNTAVAGKSEAIDMAYHYYYPHQLELLLRQAGLRLSDLLGDYAREPFTEESERLLVLAGLPPGRPA